MVADHAENLGLSPMIAENNPDLLKTDFGRKISELVYAGIFGDAYSLWGKGMNAGKDPLKGNDARTRTMSERLTAAAEEFSEPGKFTALIGFEWTSSPGGNNLHRNVLFRDGKDEADRAMPMSNHDSSDPEDLWKWMAAYEEKTDGRVLAYWKDPAFDLKQRAFYYVRVLEIPTPRWTTYDKAFFGVALLEGVPPTHQERAYTLTIWYTPKA